MLSVLQVKSVPTHVAPHFVAGVIMFCGLTECLRVLLTFATIYSWMIPASACLNSVGAEIWQK